MPSIAILLLLLIVIIATPAETRMAVLRRFVRVWLWLLIVGGALALWAISVVQQEDAKETAAQERKARAEQATAAPLRWATPAPAEPDYDKYGNPRGSRMYRAGR